MSVAQFGEHVAQHLKYLCLAHAVVHLDRISGIYVIPVNTVHFFLVIKEAIVFVQNFPQSLKVATRGVGKFILVNT